MLKLHKIILDELDDTEEDTFKLSDSLVNFGFDALEQASFQDKLNSNVLSNKGRQRL